MLDEWYPNRRNTACHIPFWGFFTSVFLFRVPRVFNALSNQASVVILPRLVCHVFVISEITALPLTTWVPRNFISHTHLRWWWKDCSRPCLHYSAQICSQRPILSQALLPSLQCLQLPAKVLYCEMDSWLGGKASSYSIYKYFREMPWQICLRTWFLTTSLVL